MASLHLLSCYMWAIKKSLAQSENSHQESHERGRRIVASIPPNCELRFWRSFKLPRYIRNIVNRCDGFTKVASCGALPPSLQSVSETLSTAAPSEMLSA